MLKLDSYKIEYDGRATRVWKNSEELRGLQYVQFEHDIEHFPTLEFRVVPGPVNVEERGGKQYVHTN